MNNYTHPQPLPLIEATFLIIAPINLTLALLILFQNSFILKDCYSNSHNLPSFMFMLIAGVDLVTALVEIARTTTAMVCVSSGDEAVVSVDITFTLITIGFISVFTSIIFNVVMNGMKTVGIACPFGHGFGKRKVIFSLVIVTAVWAVMACVDAVIYARKQSYVSSSHTCRDFWTILFDYDFTGKGTALWFFDTEIFGHNTCQTTMKLIVSFIYLVPSAINFVFMIIQIIHIRKNLSERVISISEASVSHVNITVFMVSMVFVICTSSYGIFQLVEFSLARSMTHGAEFVIKYTFHLLNATLFPIIIIWRKEPLKRRYMEFWTKVFTFPATILRKVVRCHRPTAGYHYQRINVMPMNNDE